MRGARVEVLVRNLRGRDIREFMKHRAWIWRQLLVEARARGLEMGCCSYPNVSAWCYGAFSFSAGK